MVIVLEESIIHYFSAFMDQPLSSAKLSYRRNKRWLQVSSAILIAVAILYGINWLVSPSASRSSLRTAKVELGSIAATINAGGIVIPASEETLSSETNSRIVKVLAQPGQAIKQGTPILQLETRSLDLLIENISEKIALKETQINARRLNSKKTINEINSRNELLEVELERHSVKASRLKQLSSTGAAAKHDLLEALLNVKRAKIEIRQLEQSIRDIISTTDAEIEGMVLEKSILNKSLLEQQRLKTRSTITASRAGILSWLKDEEGASVKIGEPLAKVSDSQNFRVEASLSDFYAPQLISGMKATIAYNDLRLHGELETLTPTIENGVMKLIVKLDKPNNPQLHQNIRVDVGLIIAQADHVNTLSKGPFINGKGLQEIFVIRNGVAVKTQVEVGLSNKDNYQIVHGVKPGDEVIISDVSNYIHLKEFTIN
jgi:HlyD family secretion protein